MAKRWPTAYAEASPTSGDPPTSDLSGAMSPKTAVKA